MRFARLSIRLRSEKGVEELIRNTDEEIDTKRRKEATGRKSFLSMHKSKVSVTPYPTSYDILTIRKEWNGMCYS